MRISALLASIEQLAPFTEDERTALLQAMGASSRPAPACSGDEAPAPRMSEELLNALRARATSEPLVRPIAELQTEAYRTGVRTRLTVPQEVLDRFAMRRHLSTRGCDWRRVQKADADPPP